MKAKIMKVIFLLLFMFIIAPHEQYSPRNPVPSLLLIPIRSDGVQQTAFKPGRLG